MLPFTKIALAQERLIAEEEAHPWQLLRLPATVPEVDIMRVEFLPQYSLLH